jgi:alpha/beta superfamily hydrolase
MGTESRTMCGPHWIGWSTNFMFPFCLPDFRLAPTSACAPAVVTRACHYSYKYFPGCTQPKLFISGDHDLFGPVADVEAVVATAPEPKQMVWIRDADHFFVGKLDQMQATIIDWVKHNFLTNSR